MAAIRFAVYVAPPTPVNRPPPLSGSTGNWSPISCTLIYSATEAVLVDTPITIKQTENLVNWIQKTAPDRKLSYIYITHGHGDHFFGLPILLDHFPEAVPVATRGTVRHMEQQISEPFFTENWEFRFPGQIARPLKLANALDISHSSFTLEDKWTFKAVECGQSDTHDSTILWVPQLELAVCGDVVYGQVHQMLLEANTKAKRQDWIGAIDKVEALRPKYVVPGHRKTEETDGVAHLAATRKYIEDFGHVLEGDPKDATEVFEKMNMLYPDRYNPNALKMSAAGAFTVPKEARI